MGVIDKILDVMSLNMDDEDDEFDNEDYNDYYEEEEAAPRKLFNKKEKKQEEIVKDTVYERPVSVQKKENPLTKPTSKITPISKSSRKQVSSDMEICVIQPSTIEDELEITNVLLKGKAVFINMEGLNIDLAQRIIDFTSGATYALGGNLQKVSNYNFLATPAGVDISGDIQNLVNPSSDFSV